MDWSPKIVEFFFGVQYGPLYYVFNWVANIKISQALTKLFYGYIGGCYYIALLYEAYLIRIVCKVSNGYSMERSKSLVKMPSFVPGGCAHIEFSRFLTFDPPPF